MLLKVTARCSTGASPAWDSRDAPTSFDSRCMLGGPRAQLGGRTERLQRLGRAHRSVGLLAVLDQGQERAARGEGGAVQRVHVSRPSGGRAVADVEPPRLEVGGVGAGRQLTVALL